MTNKFKINCTDGYWYIDGSPLQVPTQHIDGYTFSIGKDGRMNISQVDDTTKLDIRIFQNGRFTSKVFTDGKESGYLKKYVETPINGYLFISKNEKGVYAFFREEELQEMMDNINVDSIKSKPSKSFFINDNKWKIYDGLLSGKMINPHSFINVISSGEIKKYRSDAYIYIDFTNVEPDKRYVIIHKHNEEGNNNFSSSILYVDNLMLSKPLYHEILKKEYYWYSGNSPQKAVDERNQQIKENLKKFTNTHTTTTELEMSSSMLNQLTALVAKIARRKKNR